MNNEIIKVMVTTKDGVIMCQTEVKTGSEEHLELKARFLENKYTWNCETI